MKSLMKIGLSLALSLFLFSNAKVTEKQAKTEDSKISWKAYKVVGEHYGSVKLKEGAFKFSGKELIGGEFTIDMTSISTEDLSGEYKDKLDGHLKSDDFFAVEKFKTSTIKFNKVKKEGNAYNVEASLTIKGITKPVNFKLNFNNNIATAKLKVDRTKYDIKYGSASFFDGLKDRAINDEFDIDVEIHF